MRRTILGAWAMAAALATAMPIDAADEATDARHRGVSWVAGGRVTGEQLDALAARDVDWIVQTPFGWQQRIDTPHVQLVTGGRVLWGETDAGLRETTRLARDRGIRTMLKPHVWLRDQRDGAWRGEIRMTSEDDWQAWFASYRTFILHYARLAERLGIEALCVGTELHAAATERPGDWRRIIADVRAVYSGTLTYAANWYREYEEVEFWDDLDLIGVQGYFPLSPDPDPTHEQLVRGWTRHLPALARVHETFDKPIVFTELGYRSAPDAAARPWEWPKPGGGPVDLELQARCYRAFHETAWSQDWCGGVYWWKWFPGQARAGGQGHDGFTPQNKPAERVMTKWFGVSARREAARTPTTTPPRNVVLIVIDDMGWKDLGCTGSDFHDTPRLDALAASGVRFTDAYAAGPVCSPSRAAILTGRSPARLRITDWIPGVRYPHARLRSPPFTQELPPDEITIAEMLRARGYATLHVGKWHLGDGPHTPESQGFDVNVGGHALGAPATYFHPYASPPDARVDWSVRNLPPGGTDGDYLTDRLTDETLRLLATHAARPFFLHLSFYAVHTPIEGRPDLVARARAKKQETGLDRNAVYAAMVASVDENVGRVLDALDRLELAERTLVIVTSDNGGLERIADNSPLRAGKGHLYEGGLRVPLLVRGPGVAPGGVVRAPATSVDLLPTIAAATGATAPDRPLDGVDLGPVLRDPAAALERDRLHFHYPHYHTPRRPPSSAVREGRWKLIVFTEGDRAELYDLVADPGESVDRAAEHPDRVTRLRAALREHLDDVRAQHAVPNADHDPDHPFRDAFTAWDATTPSPVTVP